jgi:DNA-binding XRE family transcriptional regulator
MGDRQLSNDLRALGDEVRALQAGDAANKSSAAPLHCTFGPVYLDDEEATICLLIDPPRGGFAGGSDAGRKQLDAVLTRAALLRGDTTAHPGTTWLEQFWRRVATQRGYTDADQWILWRDLPDEWAHADERETRPVEANNWPDAHRYPPAPWRTVTRHYMLGRARHTNDGVLGARDSLEGAHTSLALIAEELDRQSNEALRPEPSRRKPPISPAPPAPATGALSEAPPAAVRATPDRKGSPPVSDAVVERTSDATTGATSTSGTPAEAASSQSATTGTLAQHRSALGRNIDKFRKDCGWTFEKTAEHVGISKDTVNDHINHGVQPQTPTLKAYADAFSEALDRPITVEDLERARE